MQIRKTVAGEPSGALLAARPVKGYFVHAVVFRVDFSSSNVMLTQGETYGIVLVDKEPISSTTPGKSLSWWGHQQCQGVDGAVQLWKSQNQATLVWTMATNTTKPAASFNVGIDDANADASVDSAATPDAGADLSVDAPASSWDLVRLDKFGGFVHIDKTNGAAIKSTTGITNSAHIAWDGYRKVLYRVPSGTTVSTITGVDVCTGLASTAGNLGTIKITGQTVSQISGLTVDPSTGIVYAAADLDANASAETLIRIDPSTFDGSTTTATVVGAFGGINGNQANKLFFAHGKLYATRIYNPGTGTNTEIYTVNTSTAVATSVGFLTTALPLTQVAWDPSTSALYANSYSFKVLYKIDLTNLSVTDLGGTALYQGPPIAVIERACP